MRWVSWSERWMLRYLVDGRRVWISLYFFYAGCRAGEGEVGEVRGHRYGLCHV